MLCPLCTAEVDEEKVLEEHGIYKLYECPGCRNGFWWPMKGQSADYYSHAVDSSYEARHEKLVPRINDQHRRFFELSDTKNGKLLDIGCAEGAFLKEAEKRYEVYGIDFDKNSITRAKHFGLENVFVQDLQTFSKNTGSNSFDVVTFFGVIEHQEDPTQFISQIKNLLVKGGGIAGSVPLHKSIKPAGGGDSDKPPHHFVLFTADGLRNFLELNGFDNIIVDEIFGADQARRATGVDANLLKKIFFINDDVGKNAIRYKFYSTARRTGSLFLPLINTVFSIKSKSSGNENKIKNELDKQFIPLYFQADFK